MAKQIKNTFLKSKMNKDLDDRILPNGEYRDARNVSVGRSENNDVGALENIIGNNLVAGTNVGDGLTIIGVKSNNSTNQIFVFLTDYTDPNTFSPTNAPSTSKHYIYVYNSSTEAYTKLVEGEFLNFSTTNKIIGVNLIESLLFWTDNRNQPRKINIGLANQPGGSRTIPVQYYTQEHQISVAKYNPYQAIQLYNRIDVEVLGSTAVSYFDVSGDQVAKYTPFVGASVTSIENFISGNEFIKVQGVSLNLATGDTRISVSPNFASAPSVNTFMTLIQSTMTNKSADTTWAGDPDYLEDRFVRFSYRFKYDDNEYSLMAPFTQIAYIPKQNGYFINGDEDSAYQSTIVDFMKNQVQNIGLVIPLPTNANRIVRDYKINEIEILFRESDQVAVKVLESVSAGQISGASGISNYYTYDYQSRKPYRTLPEAQTVRVYDKVPVRAFSQESSGNRIIYGNYRDQHTPPANLNYNCRITPKSDTGKYNNWIEYPNHSIKRNRNYQVGFVLSDKFGRQSPVILSSVDSGVGNITNFYSGSTIYSPYDVSQENTDVLNWFGDAISVIVNSEIASEISLASGTPGLYAIKQATTNPLAEGYAIQPNGSVIVNDTTSTFRLSATVGNLNTNIPIIGNYMRGAYEDFVLVTNIVATNPVQSQYTVTTSGRVNDVYLRSDGLEAGIKDLKFAYTINDLGWYSYKIVVKQTEQEYYNVYLPGILNGYPEQTVGEETNQVGKYNGVFPTGETNLTAFTVLFNDNINKIPRDLAEVGPEQKQFRSSVTLYGRVTNIMNTLIPDNKQYYARLSSQGKNAIAHTSTAIADAKEINMATVDVVIPTTGLSIGLSPLYQLETNPLIARISTTEKSIGTIWKNGANNYMRPFLSIYETEPVESLLDIYWETTSEGLIVDLNADVISGGGQATGFVNFTWDFTEGTSTNGAVTTSYFEPIDSEGATYTIAPEEVRIDSQVNGNNEPVELFEIEEGTGAFVGKYLIRFVGANALTFTSTSRDIDVYRLVIYVKTSTGIISMIPVGGVIGGKGALRNLIPSYTQLDNFRTAVSDNIVVPELGDTGKWADANPLNGSADTSNNRAGLEYSITTDPSPFSISRITGEITQVPNVNELKTYPTTIRLTDANGISSPNGAGGQYNQLFIEYTTNISIDYAKVNPEALNDVCTFAPQQSTDRVIVADTTNSSDPPTGTSGVSGIWYIRESTSEKNAPVDSEDNSFLSFSDVDNEFEISSGSHKSGTLSFTSNAVQQKVVFDFAKVFKAAETIFFYRKVDDSDWIELPRAFEYNQAGTIFPPETTSSVKRDWPGGSNGLIIGNSDSVPSGDNYLSNIRAFDYSSFGANGTGIEYAIVVSKLQKLDTGLQDVIGWVVADDLHYPKCIPWQGSNAAPVNEGDSYEYFRSQETNAPVVDLNVDTLLKIYAETPYGEYVNKFYTDEERTEVYTPSEETKFINFELHADNYSETAALWTTLGASQPNVTSPTEINLRWAAGFDDDTGIKLFNASNDSGVRAIQTSPLDPVVPPSAIKAYATSRIKIIS